jgi:prophage antirepressor-like protein
MSELQNFFFEGQEIRFVGTSEVPEWIGSDIVAILYPEVDPKNRATYLRGVPSEWKGLQKVQTLGGAQDMATVFEPGLYSLIARSSSPLAIPFQKWVFVNSSSPALYPLCQRHATRTGERREECVAS